MFLSSIRVVLLLLFRTGEGGGEVRGRGRVECLELLFSHEMRMTCTSGSCFAGRHDTHNDTILHVNTESANTHPERS